MSVAWNDDDREWRYAPWKCSEGESAKHCPTGYKADKNKYQADKFCNDKNNNCRTKNGCPNSCNGDQRRIISFTGMTCASPIYNRERVRCYKNNYNTDNTTLLNCCLGKTLAKNCHTKYYKNSAHCNNIIDNYCKEGNLSKSDCSVWCANNPTECKAKIRDYCRLPSQFNKGSYCRNKAIEIGGMDNAVKEYCKTNINDEFCSCYKSLEQTDSEQAQNDPTLKAIFARPECYISKCASGGGYKNENMRQAKQCPSVNVCQNTITALGNTDTGLINTTQKCNQEQNSGGSQREEVPEPEIPEEEEIDLTNYENIKKNIILFILLLIGFLLIYKILSPGSISVNDIFGGISDVLRRY